MLNSDWSPWALGFGVSILTGAIALTTGFAFGETFGGVFGFATTFGFTAALALTTGFFLGAGFSLLAGFALPFGFTFDVVLPRRPARAFSAKRTFAIMMVLSSAAVLGGRFEEEAGFAAFADFDLAEVFLKGFFRGLVLYGFLGRCLELRGGWFKLRIAVELSGRSGMGRNTQAGVLCFTSLAA
jgi:hypothetical protein